MLAGAVQVRVAWAFPGATLRVAGAVGTPGVTLTASEAVPGSSVLSPSWSFTARIWKVTDVPLVRLPTVWLVVLASLLEISAQAAVPCLIWYLVMLASVGLSQVSVASTLPGAADRPVGLAGAAPCGVAVAVAEGGLAPASFSARIAKA